jgi:hypothetical protein
MMRIRKNKNKNKRLKSSSSIALDSLNKPIIKNTALWKIMISFATISLILVNLLNYWQPVNHNDVKQSYDKQQSVILSAYTLQDYISKFKANPEQHAFNVIQQTVALDGQVRNINDRNNQYMRASAKKLNTNIEKIMEGIPSIKLFQENIDIASRKITTLKYHILDSIDANKLSLVKSLLVTADKIEELVQKLKFDHWSSTNLVENYQKSIEDIGLEIEQFNSLIVLDEVDSKYEGIINTMSEVFNELSSLMPAILSLSEVTSQFSEAKQNQENIVNDIKQHEVPYINNIDDKTIIVVTILLTNILLFVLIFIAKLTEKTRNIYNNLKTKKEIYYLSHDKSKVVNSDVKSIPANKSEMISETAKISQGKQINIDSLLKIKERILNDCYILQDNVDKIDKYLSKHANNIAKQDQLPSHILIILHKISNNILDHAILLDRNLDSTKSNTEVGTKVGIKEQLDQIESVEKL